MPQVIVDKAHQAQQEDIKFQLTQRQAQFEGAKSSSVCRLPWRFFTPARAGLGPSEDEVRTRNSGPGTRGGVTGCGFQLEKGWIRN